MRNTLINLIRKEIKNGSDIYFLTADLGFSVIEDFQGEYPDRCINIGISEQNMIGIAAGLALSGKKVFVYSIVPFATMRCFEQIKVDVCYQNLDVNIIGIGGGFAYGNLGPTHHAIEDISVMSSLPNMKVVCFADSLEVEKLFPQILKKGGPMYLRLNRGGESNIHENDFDVKFGKGIVVKEGTDVVLIATGRILEVVVKLAKILENDGISVEVVSMPFAKPLDRELLKDLADGQKAVFTVEEHNVLNGFGAMVASFFMESNIKPRIFKRFGVEDVYPEFVGKQDYLRDLNNLSPEKLYRAIKDLYV